MSFFWRRELPGGVWDADIDAYPDSKYKFEESGYRCKIVRNQRTYTYCGYITLPRNHPDFGKSFDDLENEIAVHGGLSYGKNGVFGFDCNHVLMGDISPADALMMEKFKGEAMAELFDPKKRSITGRTHYWTFEEVKRELAHMARQFKNRE
jgi:hypothetical protein